MVLFICSNYLTTIKLLTVLASFLFVMNSNGLFLVPFENLDILITTILVTINPEYQRSTVNPSSETLKLHDG